MRKFVTRLHTLLFSAFILVLLAACTPSTVSPTATVPPAGTFVPQQRDLPTLPPPAWVPVAQEIKLANVTNIAYLGRLDAKSTPSTVFAYAFSPDGSRLVGLNNEQLIGWDLVTGKLLFNTARL